MRYLLNSISIRKWFIAILLLSTLLSGIVLFTGDLYGKRIQTYVPTHRRIPENRTRVPENNVSSWLEYRRIWNGEILINIKPVEKMIVFTYEYQLRMISKGLHPLSVRHEYLHKRIRRVEKYCSAFLPVNQSWYEFGRGQYSVLFNDKVELLQCEIPKVSSSTWANTFVNLFEHSNKYFRTSGEVARLWQNISLVYNYNDERLVAQRYQTYTKFLITRNPFERLLSAYTSKFTQNQIGYEKRYAPIIITANYLSDLKQDLVKEVREKLKRGKNISNTELDASTIQQIKRLDAGVGNYKITFLEFLNYIILQITDFGRKSLDYHWAPITVVCDPCTIRYDVIAKFETLHEDSQIILDYVQDNTPNLNVSFPKRNASITEDLCNKAFKDIPLRVRTALYRFYKEDFILFGYQYYVGNPNKRYC